MAARNTSKLYRDENHYSDIFTILRKRRKDPFFHNVNLLVDNIEIPTNKMLLAASSPYFFTMFTSCFQENMEKNVRINEISAEILTLIIDYVYTSEILITEENVEDLLAASNLLQFDGISNKCIQFLKDQIQPTNCLGIQAIADSYNFPDLVNDIKIFIDRNFEAVTKSEEFLLLPLNEVCSLISRDQLRVPTEKDVLRAVIAWIDHDIASRKQHVLLLMKNVRFRYLSEKHVQKIFLNHRLCRDNPIGLIVKPRRYIDLSKILLVAGGDWSAQSIEYYNFKEDSWSMLTNLPVTRYVAGMSVLNGKLYIIGGVNFSGKNENKVDIYDIATDQWTSSIHMQFKRQHLGAVTLKNCIYAVGGYGARGTLNTVEKFDSETKQWTTVAPMLTGRNCHGVAVMDDVLYVVGGEDDISSSDSVECYNPLTDTWTYVKNMHLKRWGVAVGVLNGLLYAVGGSDGLSDFKSGETFDPKTGNWTMISDMNHPRSCAAVVSANNLLYVIGGSNGPHELDSIEEYDPETNQWTLLQSSMVRRRHFHCAAVVDKRI